MADDKRKKDETTGMPNRSLPSGTPPTAAGAVRRTLGGVQGAINGIYRPEEAGRPYAQRVGATARRLADTYEQGAGVVRDAVFGGVAAADNAIKRSRAAIGRVGDDFRASFAAGTPTAAPASPTPAAAPRPPAPAPSRPAAAAGTGGTPDRSGVNAAANPSPAPISPASAKPSSPVVGTFNGRDITRAETEQLARRLPTASGPVATGDGGFAFSPGAGAAPSSATTQAPNAVEAVAVDAPTVQVPRTLRGDLRGAERERAAAAERIGDQLRWMSASPAGLNSRGERQLYAQLLDTQRQLTGQRVDQATTLETQGAQIDATAAGQSAQIAAGTLQSNADRALQAKNFTSQDADRDAALELQRRGISQVLTGQDGTANVLRADGSLAPLTGADGQPFRQLTDPKRSGTVSPDTEYRSLSEQLTQLQAFGRPEGAEGTAYDQQLAQIRARMAQLSGTGGGAQDKPPEGFPNARKAPDGNWYVRNDDGSYSMVR